MARYWFEATRDIIPNHVISIPIRTLSSPASAAAGRSCRARLSDWLDVHLNLAKYQSWRTLYEARCRRQSGKLLNCLPRKAARASTTSRLPGRKSLAHSLVRETMAGSGGKALALFCARNADRPQRLEFDRPLDTMQVSVLDERPVQQSPTNYTPDVAAADLLAHEQLRRTPWGRGKAASSARNSFASGFLHGVVL